MMAPRPATTNGKDYNERDYHNRNDARDQETKRQTSKEDRAGNVTTVTLGTIGAGEQQRT